MFAARNVVRGLSLQLNKYRSRATQSELPLEKRRQAMTVQRPNVVSSKSSSARQSRGLHDVLRKWRLSASLKRQKRSRLRITAETNQAYKLSQIYLELSTGGQMEQAAHALTELNQLDPVIVRNVLKLLSLAAIRLSNMTEYGFHRKLERLAAMDSALAFFVGLAKSKSINDHNSFNQLIIEIRVALESMLL